MAKQPGTSDEAVVMIRAPQEFVIESADFEMKENIALFNGTLRTDKKLAAVLKNNPTPPLITSKYLDGRQSVIIYFDRAIASNAAEDGLNYEIKDLNVQMPEITDKAFVRAVGYAGNKIVLHLEGMSEQPGEEYEVIMKNLQDNNGIYTEPDPLRFKIAQEGSFTEDIGGPAEN